MNQQQVDCYLKQDQLFPLNNQSKICFEKQYIMQFSYRKNTIFKTLLSIIFTIKFLCKI